MTDSAQWHGDWPNGWWPNCSDGFSDIEAYIDTTEIRNGLPSTYLKSSRDNFEEMDCPKLTKCRAAKDFQGNRVSLIGWAKTNIAQGSAHFWIRVDGNWTHEPLPQSAYFDNMHARPITGQTDWTKYELIVDVPITSTDIVYGIFLRGFGELWFNDVVIQTTNKNTPLTGYNWL